MLQLFVSICGMKLALNYFLSLHLYMYALAECTAMKSLASLPEDCALYCSFAQSKLEEIWEQMLDGKIAVFELQKVFRNQQHMENLCCAVGIGIDVKDTRRRQQWSTETVHNVIQQRVKEVSAIHDYREQLKYLCTLIPYSTGTCLQYTCACICKCIICHQARTLCMYMCTYSIYSFNQ